jgi:hypothetical protein
MRVCVCVAAAAIQHQSAATEQLGPRDILCDQPTAHNYELSRNLCKDQQPNPLLAQDDSTTVGDTPTDLKVNKLVVMPNGDTKHVTYEEVYINAAGGATASVGVQKPSKQHVSHTKVCSPLTALGSCANSRRDGSC